jgi:hypothetical protein
MSLNKKIKKYFENNKKEIAATLCGYFMLNGCANVYEIYKSLV